MSDRLRRRVVLPLACFLVVAMAVFMAPTFLVQAGSMPYLRTVQDAPPEDVLVVLGAAVGPDGRPSPYLAGRLDVAADLHRRGKARVLLLSGAAEGSWYDEPAVMRRYLLGKGVPSAAMVEDREGDDTYLTCHRMVAVYGVRRALVVTNDFHLARAVTLCRSAGAHVYGVPDTTPRQISRSEFARMQDREHLAAGKAVLDIVLRDEGSMTTDDAVRKALASQGG